ncbi:unnamed protein product [[Candida] boidinii]|nr:unnamed protein product [[Candida] boidinii]
MMKKLVKKMSLNQLIKPLTNSSIIPPTTVNNNKKPIDVKLGSSDIFTWQNLDYVIQYDGADRKLLDNVQGFVKPGTLTALMGESGAGKTTLLNALSRRTEVGIITGDMLVNGSPVDSSFKRKTGYVQQQDVHVTELTVRESLIFAARLRRPITVSDEEKISYVDEIIQVLDMYDYKDALVGVPGYGLNVEQRKKLSIATELVAKPELLLFLDEPTSGLDSQSSWAIVQFILVISVQILRLLDYFENQGARKCQSNENPAEYILEVIGAGATATVNEDWNEIWLGSKNYQNVCTEIDEILKNTNSSKSDSATSPDAKDDKSLTSAYATPYLYQLKYVIFRGSLQLNRDIVHQVSRTAYLLSHGLIVGFSFWNVKHTIIGMQNTMFANLFAVISVYALAATLQGLAIKGLDTGGLQLHSFFNSGSYLSH